MSVVEMQGLPPLSSRYPRWPRTTILTISRNSENGKPTIEVKKSHSGELLSTSVLLSTQDYLCRIAHLEQSIKFLQEQHQLMLSGLHSELESLRERNRDLQFQLIFNKETSSRGPASQDKPVDTAKKEEDLSAEIERLEKEVTSSKNEAKAAETKANVLQELLDVQTEKLNALELGQREGDIKQSESEAESPEELRARLADAERLVRRLRTDADRQRREVFAGAGAGVTNLLFDDAAARVAHLQCMKNSLSASLRVTGVDAFAAHFRPPNYFPPVQPEFWQEPLREEFHMNMMTGRARARRPVTLPDLAAHGQHIPKPLIYANHHARFRQNGQDYHNKSERKKGHNPAPSDTRCENGVEAQVASTSQLEGPTNASHKRGKRHQHRKALSTDHT